MLALLVRFRERGETPVWEERELTNPRRRRRVSSFPFNFFYPSSERPTNDLL